MSTQWDREASFIEGLGEELIICICVKLPPTDRNTAKSRL